MKAIIIIIGLILITLHSHAQGLFNASDENEGKTLEYSGYARSVIAGGAENYDFSTAFGEFAIKPKVSMGHTFLFADLRFREDWAFNEHQSTFEPKELYAGYKSDKVDVFLGNQIVTWGRTDGFNPTNKVTPNDYFFISPEPDDQKLSNFMLRSKIRFSPEAELDVIGIPFYKPSIYRYDLFQFQPGFTFNNLVVPDRKIENASYAARLNFEYPAAGFSISWQSGYSPFYGFDIQSAYLGADGSYTVENIAKTYKQQTAGADFTLPLGSLILRGEAAYNITSNYKDSIFIPNPDLAYVAGIEANFADITAIFQYVGKTTLKFDDLAEPVLTDPTSATAQMAYGSEMIQYQSELFNRKIFDQQEKTNQAVMLSLNRDFWYNALNVELTAYYNFTTESVMLRPMLSWKIDDMLTAKAGGSYMHGPDNSIFNYSAPVLNNILLSLQANF